MFVFVPHKLLCLPGTKEGDRDYHNHSKVDGEQKWREKKNNVPTRNEVHCTYQSTRLAEQQQLSRQYQQAVSEQMTTLMIYEGKVKIEE